MKFRMAVCVAFASVALSAGAMAQDAATLISRGSALVDDRKFKEATAALSEALALAPGNAEALVLRGNAYVGERKYKPALADYDAAIQRAPNNAEAFIRRGNAYFVLGRTDRKYYDRAVEDFDAAIKLKPDSAVAHNNRAYAGARADIVRRHRPLNEMRDVLERTVAGYDAAIKLAPDFVLAYLNRAGTISARADSADRQRIEADAEEAVRHALAAPNDAWWIRAGALPLGTIERTSVIRESDDYDRKNVLLAAQNTLAASRGLNAPFPTAPVIFAPPPPPPPPK